MLQQGRASDNPSHRKKCLNRSSGHFPISLFLCFLPRPLSPFLSLSLSSHSFSLPPQSSNFSRFLYFSLYSMPLCAWSRMVRCSAHTLTFSDLTFFFQLRQEHVWTCLCLPLRACIAFFSTSLREVHVSEQLDIDLKSSVKGTVTPCDLLQCNGCQYQQTFRSASGGTRRSGRG